MSYLKSLILLLFLILVSVNLVSAGNDVQEFKYEGIKGAATGGKNDSPEQVYNQALNEAKLNALKKAGVEENIASFTSYFQIEENGKYEDLFSSDFLSDIRGAVKEVNVVDEKRSLDEFGNLRIELTVNCTVVKYLTERDLTFDAKIEGVGMFYPNESNLLFTVKPSKDTYVKIFILSESEAFQLFPNDYESSYLLKENSQYLFPSETMDYTLHTNKKSENHRMIMVFMKQDIPYTDEVEYKKIIDWIFSIPPHLRILKSYGFVVVNENKKTVE